MAQHPAKLAGPSSTTFGELLETFESLSLDERRAEIERTNRYLASREGRREFGDLLTAVNRMDIE